MPDRPFRLRDADPFRRRDKRYDGQTWVTPYAGVRVPARRAHLVETRIAAAALIVPDGGALAGWGAAWLHGDRWATGTDAHGLELPVPIALRHHSRIRRAGVWPINGVLEPNDVWKVKKYPATSPVRTAFDVARLLDLEAAVAAVDSLLNCRATSLERLAAYLDAHPGMKGVAQARLVIELASPYAESPPESRMRLFWRSLGITNVLVNPIIKDEHGRFVGRVDLFDEEAGMVGEYQGDIHRDPARWRKDLRRKRRLGLIVCEAASGDMWPGSAYAQDVLMARCTGLQRDRRLDRWQVVPREAVVADDEPWWLDGS